VQRDAEEGGLDNQALFKRTRQLLLAKVGEPRPERDVRRQRVLSLQRAEALDGLLDAELPALQQYLPREERAIELAQRQDAFVAQARDVTGSGRSETDGPMGSSAEASS
jgi:hypothetical protein